MSTESVCYTSRAEFSYPNARVLIFAKAPIAGEVKTRLIPPLSPAEAARLHARFVHRTLGVACGSKLCPVQLWCSPQPRHPFFADCQRSFPVSQHTQHGAGLGERMRRAAASALKEADCMVLIGCDCPTLTAAYLQQAFTALKKGYNAVVGPAEDGGYVLLGLRHAEPELFSGIAWGTDSVLDGTRRRLRRLQWRWHELAEQWDVDRPEDLVRLKRNRVLAAEIGLSAVIG
jgi:uncharacterized protein